MENIKKIVCYSTPYFTCVDVTFMNSKFFFKTNSRANVLLDILEMYFLEIFSSNTTKEVKI